MLCSNQCVRIHNNMSLNRIHTHKHTHTRTSEFSQKHTFRWLRLMRLVVSTLSFSKLRIAAQTKWPWDVAVCSTFTVLHTNVLNPLTFKLKPMHSSAWENFSVLKKKLTEIIIDLKWDWNDDNGDGEIERKTERIKWQTESNLMDFTLQLSWNSINFFLTSSFSSHLLVN